MKQHVLTQGYIDGNQDCLTSIVNQLNSSLRKHHNGKPSGVVSALNEFMKYLYFKQEVIEDMTIDFSKQQDAIPEPYEEETCATREDKVEIKSLTPIFYVIKNGKPVPVFEGGM